MDAARRVRIEPQELERHGADPADRLARPVARVARPVIPPLVDAVQEAFRPLERRKEEVAVRTDRLDERVKDRLRAADDVPAGRERRMDKQCVALAHPHILQCRENRRLADLGIAAAVALRPFRRHHRLDDLHALDLHLEESRARKRPQPHALSRRDGYREKRRVLFAVIRQRRLLVRLLEAFGREVADESSRAARDERVEVFGRERRLWLQHHENAARVLAREELRLAHYLQCSHAIHQMSASL